MTIIKRKNDSGHTLSKNSLFTGSRRIDILGSVLVVIACDKLHHVLIPLLSLFSSLSLFGLLLLLLPMLQAWTGQPQVSTSVYGIRVYHNNSILTPHVDRLPLVSSAIINVAQDVDEPWYLEVYDHSGVGTCSTTARVFACFSVFCPPQTDDSYHATSIVSAVRVPVVFAQCCIVVLHAQQ